MLPDQNQSKQSGYVMLVAMVILAGVMVLGVAMMSKSVSGKRAVTSGRNATQSRYAGESAIALLINRAANAVDSNGYLVEFPPTNFTIHGHQATVDMEIELDDNGDTRVDSLRGKFDLMTFRSYANIEAEVKDPVSRSTARIRQRVAFDQYPLFQFAVFWEGVLLLDPGSNMNIGGRMHSNSRIKLYPGANLTLNDWVTSTCDIWHMGTGSTKIKIKRLDGTFPSGFRTTFPSTFTAIDTPYYSDTKKVRMAMGQQVPFFRVPVGTRNPLLIIQPKGVDDQGVAGFTESITTKRQKLVYKADLIFRKRNATGVVVKQWSRNQSDGTDVNVSNSLKNAYNLAIDTLPHAGNHPDSLWEFGDQKWMNATYFNVGKFFTNNTVAGDQVIYLEGQFDNASIPAKRDVFVIWNGSTLNRNFTIVSNCPVYIFGNYNTTGPVKNAAIMGDLITQLSRSWRGSYTSATTTRTASNDSVFACIMGGVHRARVHPTWNTPTDINYYNWNQDDNVNYSDRIGQPHNHLTFMENWSANTFTYKGSLVALWRCLYITGNFRFNPGNTIYSQPIRNYDFDSRYNDIKNMPPGTPTVISPFNLDYYEIHEE